jgi:GNAT superfamily N-acetyltransferase
VIRRAEPSDAAALVALGSAVGREPEGWLITSEGWRGVNDERRYLRALKRYPNAAVFVAELEGRIVARLSIARDQHPASHHVADLGLMVAVGARRRGVGSALLETAVGWARSSGTSSRTTSRRSASTSGSASSARATGRATTGAAASLSTRS